MINRRDMLDILFELNDNIITYKEAVELVEEKFSSDNSQSDAICPECKNSVSIRDLELLRQCPHCKVDYPFIIHGKQHPVR